MNASAAFSACFAFRDYKLINVLPNGHLVIFLLTHRVQTDSLLGNSHLPLTAQFQIFILAARYLHPSDKESAMDCFNVFAGLKPPFLLLRWLGSLRFWNSFGVVKWKGPTRYKSTFVNVHKFQAHPRTASSYSL